MEIVVKQIVGFVSKVLIVLLFISCSHPASVQISDNQQLHLDTSVNGFILDNDSSFVNKMKDIRFKIIDDYYKGEGVLLTNEDNTEYFFLNISNGGSSNQYDYFFIEKSGVKESAIKLNVKKFISNNGVQIGMDINDFKIKYKTLTFDREDRSDTLILKYENDNNYYARYSFVSDKIVKYEFGYIY